MEVDFVSDTVLADILLPKTEANSRCARIRTVSKAVDKLVCWETSNILTAKM